MLCFTKPLKGKIQNRRLQLYSQDSMQRYFYHNQTVCSYNKQTIQITFKHVKCYLSHTYNYIDGRAVRWWENI